jgi:RNA polymerase sigma factor (sigma-70 family)
MFNKKCTPITMSQSLESTATPLPIDVDNSDETGERLSRCFLAVMSRWTHGRLSSHVCGVSATEDLVQSTLIRTHNQVEDFDSLMEGAFLAFLSAILLNSICMGIRRVTGRNRQGFAGSEAEPTDPEASVMSEAIGLGVQERYEAALMTLTDKAREAVRLRVEFGYSFQEIADATETPSANSARMLVSRSQVQLAEAMK